MRIRSLRLAAYGPFSDVTIDLPDTGLDFHLLFGPNEAGKSSALRALRHMLFGIPARTADNFLHGYARLRIGARLVNGAGDEIAFLRRKGLAKTLRGPDDDTVLDDEALAPFLGGVGAEVFEQMFAIGHEDLIRGGEEIVSGRGSIGEALFAAGAGLIRLQTVQQDLENRCGALFKPSGSTPAINQAIKAVKAERQAQREVQLLPKTWREHNQALIDARQRMGALMASLGSRRQRQARLERIRDALPLIVRKREIDARLVAYRGVPDLADDFGDQRRDAEKELKLADRDLERARTAIATVDQAIEALPVDRALLDHAAAIEALQHELGSFRKAQQDRPGLDGRLRTLQKQAADRLAEIRADLSGEAAGELRLPPSTVGEIQELGTAYERLTTRQEAVADQQRRRAIRMDQLTARRRATAPPVDVSTLETALQDALEAGPIERQLAERRAAEAALEEELDRALKRQPLWRGSLAAVEAAPLPSQATVDRFDARVDELRRTRDRLGEAMTATEGELAQTVADLQALDGAQAVPTETDLERIRSLRDQAWGLVRERLAGREPPAEDCRAVIRRFDGAVDLPEAVDAGMRRADTIADRLRREAQRVEMKGLLEARQAKLEKARAGVAAQLETDRAQTRAAEAEWRAAWEPAGISPQSPREMRSWLSDIESLRDRAADWRSRTAQTARLAGQLAEITADLAGALEAAGLPPQREGPLTRLIKTAQAFIDDQKGRHSEIAALDREWARLEAEREEGASTLAQLADALAQWKAGWEASVEKIGIRTDTTPSGALAVIEGIREVRGKTAEADVLCKRIDGIDRDAAAFTARVTALVDRLAPDLCSESRDRAAERLNGRLTRARSDLSRRQGLVERRDALRNEGEEAERRRFECRAVIDLLCREARCAGTESLAEAETRARERTAMVRELDALEQRLRQLSGGATLDAFIEEASRTDPDGIDAELQELGAATEALETERSDLDQQIGALKATLQRMDGRSEAAAHAETAERLLAGLEADVETYARLKIASFILSRTVDQYRDKHQGPLIARAGDLFARMTRGAFDRLRADYDDKGNPVLVGIRATGGAAVTVEGMSDGTADQLYLALRLASLEQYLEANEPLPFVVDDILLRFDDDRALATLGVLADLATRTQVLFFTHHRHLVALAGRSGTDLPAFHVQQL